MMPITSEIMPQKHRKLLRAFQTCLNGEYVTRNPNAAENRVANKGTLRFRPVRSGSFAALRGCDVRQIIGEL